MVFAGRVYILDLNKTARVIFRKAMKHFLPQSSLRDGTKRIAYAERQCITWGNDLERKDFSLFTLFQQFDFVT